MAVRLNVQKLIDALGGATALANIAGAPRTAPYRWKESGRVSSYVFEKIKAARPDIDLDYFFEEV